VFFIVVLFVWTAMNAYVCWRLASIPLIAAHLSRAALISIAAFLWIIYLLSRNVERFVPPLIGQVLEWVGANWFGVLFLMFVCLLVADIITGFGFLLPRLAPALRTWALAAAAALCMIALVQGLRAPVVSSYEVRLSGLPAASDGTVLVVISDTHLGTMIGPGWLAARVEQIQALRPDAIILAGDILEGDSDRRERDLLPLLRRLSPPLGSWAVMGNHEFYAGVAFSVNGFEQAGVKLLRDRWTEVKPGLVFAGVDDLTVRRRRGIQGDFIERSVSGRPAGAATVLISHSPWEADRAARAGVGLMLSGHTHNGQIWPFSYVVRALYPMLGGRYDVDGMPVIVCRGTGTWGPRMRLWRPGEIVRITLRAAPIT
jgi:uncharacterized protein